MRNAEAFVISNDQNELTSLNQSYIENVERQNGIFLPDRKLTGARNITVITESANVTLSLSTMICGLPGFCAANAYNACINTPIAYCDQCGAGRLSAYLFAAVALGLCIFIGNLIVILVTKHRYHNQTMNKTDLCRTSLATADLLLGFNFTITSFYNFSWTVKRNSIELDFAQLLSRGSSGATVGGVLFMYGFTSSIYHLLYMSLLRFYAIKYPVEYQILSDKKVKWHLLTIWIFVLVPSTIPMWFPGVFIYSYSSSILLFFPSVQTMSSPTYEVVVTFSLTALLIVMPFVVTVATTIGAGIILRKQIQLRSHLSESSHGPDRKLSKRDLSSFQTLAFMLLGFAIPPIPLIVVGGLLLSNNLSCSESSPLVLVGVMLAITTSFINVIIYSAKDKTFRKAVRTISKKLISQACEDLSGSTPRRYEIEMVQPTKPNSTNLDQC